MTEEEQALLDAHGKASQKLMAGINEKATAGAQQSNEVVYNVTYNAVARFGLAQPLPRRYTYKGMAPTGGRS